MRKFWERTLQDARMAEQIQGFTAEEKRSWNEHLRQLRKQAIDALRAARNFSCMLWEQMSEGEEFELNPERYWRDIIANSLERARPGHGLAAGAAAPPEDESPTPEPPRPFLAGGAAAAACANPYGLPTEEVEAPPPLPTPAQPLSDTITQLLEEKPKRSDWASRTCSALCAVLDDIEKSKIFVADPANVALAHRLVQAAYDDCEFCHCSLSIAEDVRYALEEL